MHVVFLQFFNFISFNTAAEVADIIQKVVYNNQNNLQS